MDERDWDACCDPEKMLDFLRDTGRASERKLRLFAVACCRRIWPLLVDERSRRAVEMAERYADGLASDEELRQVRNSLREVSAIGWPSVSAWQLAWDDAPATCHAATQALIQNELQRVQWADNVDELCEIRCSVQRSQAHLLGDIFGNPFRTVFISPSCLTPQVAALAQHIYDQRAWDCMPELAAVLEEAGCTDPDILGHLRDPGPTPVEIPRREPVIASRMQQLSSPAD